MTGHREIYQNALRVLENDIFEMSEIVIKSITLAFDSYKNLKPESARQVIDSDSVIDNKRWEIEDKCITLIATQTPVASDLREVISILNIVTELERIADYSSGIAEIAIRHGDTPHIKPLIDIERMYEKSVYMIQGAIKSFIERNVELAKEIYSQDPIINQLYEQIFREIITYTIENPQRLTLVTYTIWVAHKFERIGDRVKNICERTVFLVKGKMEDMRL